MAALNKEDKIIYENSGIIDVAPNVIERTTGQQLIDNHLAADEKSNIATVTQSPNFRSGVSGWRLNSNGILEANGAIIT